MIVRPVIFHPQAREAIRLFPKDVRDRLGRSLFRLQMGEQPRMPQARPMPSVDVGVSELRVRGEDGVYRVFFQTAGSRNVLVFHAFVKKTQRTPAREIRLAQQHLKELLDAQE